MTQQQAQTIMIGEFNYTMYSLPPIPSHKLLLRFTKMVGPSLGEVIDSVFGLVKNTKSEKEIDYSGLNPIPKVKEEKEIEESTEQVGKDIEKLILKTLGSIAKGENLPDLGKVFSKFFVDLDEELIASIMQSFAPVTEIEGVGSLSDKFDSHFRGRLDEMYHWLFWGMGVQWGKCLRLLPIEMNS